MTNRQHAVATRPSLSDKVRVANLLSDADVVPEQYRRKPANCLVAVDYADHMDFPVLAVMRGTYVVRGKLGFSAEFVVALINSSGKFDNGVEWEEEGDANEDVELYRVRALGRRGERVFYGPWVDIQMARDEGWASSNSKYHTMPQIMLTNRATTFFGRRYAPEALLGIQTRDELDDFQQDREEPRIVTAESAAVEINRFLDAEEVPSKDDAQVGGDGAEEREPPAVDTDEFPF